MTEKVSLGDFIREKYPLVATIGVFGAVTALFSRLEGIGDIAFVTLMIFFVLMWELLDSFPEIKVPLKSSIRLLIFQFLMILFLMGVGWYILVTYVSVYYELFLLAVVLGVYSLISIEIIVRIRLFERIHNEIKGELYGIIKFILLLFIVGIVFVSGANSASFIIGLFESL